MDWSSSWWRASSSRVDTRPELCSDRLRIRGRVMDRRMGVGDGVGVEVVMVLRVELMADGFETNVVDLSLATLRRRLRLWTLNSYWAMRH